MGRLRKPIEEAVMDAVQAIRGRRSIRRYRDTSVPRTLITEVILDAVHAPWTPLSLPDPWIFNVIEGRDRIAVYGREALEFARRHRPQIRGYEWTERPGFSVFHGAPVVILISGREDYPPALEECTRAGQNLAVGAHARGLGTCWVGAPNLWLAAPATRSELRIPDGFVPFAAFSLGYPAETPPARVPIQPRLIWCDPPDAPNPAGSCGPDASGNGLS